MRRFICADITHTKLLLYPCISAVLYWLYWIHQGPFPTGQSGMVSNALAPQIYRTHNFQDLEGQRWHFAVGLIVLARSRCLVEYWYVILVSWTSICSRTRTEYVAFALTRWFVLECPEQVFFCYIGNLPSFFAWAGLHHFTEYDHISRHSLQKPLKNCWNVPNSVDIVTSTTEMSEMCCNSALERHKLDHIKLQPALWISDQVNQASAKHFSEVSWIFRLSGRIHQLPTLGMSRMSFASASGNLVGYRDIGIWMWMGELVQPPSLDLKQRCLWKFACKSEQKYPSRYICQGNSGIEPCGVGAPLVWNSKNKNKEHKLMI